MNVNIKKLSELAVIPSYAHDGDMGMDITAISIEYRADIDCWIYHTGLAFEIPYGYGMLAFPRSSNRKTDAYIPNGVPIIDSGYRGELMICFKNRDASNTTEPYQIGDRIAQVVILPYPKINFIEVNNLSDTTRGNGGFGSTGK